MEYLEQVLKYFVKGDSPNEWLIMKFILAAIGGLSAFLFKHYSSGESKVNFWWKGFWFMILSAFGGVLILGPKTAVNAFVAGLLGWSAIANVLKQENEGASDEKYKDSVLTKEELEAILNDRKDD